jgi:hypothetical protein
MGQILCALESNRPAYWLSVVDPRSHANILTRLTTRAILLAGVLGSARFSNLNSKPIAEESVKWSKLFVTLRNDQRVHAGITRELR